MFTHPERPPDALENASSPTRCLCRHVVEVPKYVHEKHYVPEPVPSPPKYHQVPVAVPVKEPGKAGREDGGGGDELR